jgi:hypothetical protein
MTVREDEAPTTTMVAGERTSPAMTSTAAPARIVQSRVPSRLVLRMINPFVSAILRSPMHRLLSNQMLLLTFIGHKSWRRYTIPVGYTREGDTLTIFSSRSWYKNLRGGRSVALHLGGRAREGRAEVIEDRAAVMEAAERLVAKYGLKEAGRRIGLALEIIPPPTKEELDAALEDRVVIRVVLGQGNGADSG